MNFIFASYLYAFNPFDYYTPDATPVYGMILTCEPLDKTFVYSCSSDSKLDPATRISKYFGEDAYQYLAPISSYSYEFDVAVNGLGPYEAATRFSGASAARQGQLQAFANGRYIAGVSIYMAKTALSMAASASAEQMKNVPSGANPGILGQAFRSNPGNPVAPTIIDGLSKFLDGRTIRETLFDYSLGANHGQVHPGVAVRTLDRLQPGSNIAKEASMAEEAATGRRMIEEDVAARVRFYRQAPAFSRFGLSQIDLVNRIANQHRRANGFKTLMATRF